MVIEATMPEGSNLAPLNKFRLHNVIRFLFLVAVFLVLFSPTMVYVAAFAAVLTLFSADCRTKLPQLFRLTPVRLGLLYLLVVIAGIFYTPAIKSDIIKELLVTGLFVFFLPLLVTVFGNKAWQQRLLLTLFASAFVLALRMVAAYFSLIPASWSHFFLFKIHYIQQAATLVALGIYLGLYLALEASSKIKRGVFIGLAIFLIVVSLAFQREKVGMILSFVTLLLFFLQHLRCLKWICLMLLGYSALVGVIYHYSTATQSRINSAVYEAHHVQPTRLAHAASVAEVKLVGSINLRWHTALSALEASKIRPIFGFGTGTFSMSHKSNPPGMTGNMLIYLSTTTPEVGSLFLLMRHGWLGFLVWVAFMFSWWLVCRPLGFNKSCLVFATLAVLVLADCSFPAFYHSRAWVWLFAVLIPVAGSLFEDDKKVLSKG
jgi:hypothetical protein